MNINKQEIYEIIWNMADITESFTFYGFSQYMYKKTENVIWLNLSASLLSFTFCCVEGAYAVGIFHAREAVGIEKNLENLVNENNDASLYSQAQQAIVENALYMAQTIKNLLSVALMDENGEITKEIRAARMKADRALKKMADIDAKYK